MTIVRKQALDQARDHVVSARNARDKQPEQVNLLTTQALVALNRGNAEEAFFATLSAVRRSSHYETVAYLVEALHVLKTLFDGENDEREAEKGTPLCAQHFNSPVPGYLAASSECALCKDDSALLHRYFTVAGLDAATLKSFLYGHSEIVALTTQTTGSGTRYHYLVRTSAKSDVDYLATYQRDRIASGSFAAGLVFDNKETALNVHATTWNTEALKIAAAVSA